MVTTVDKPQEIQQTNSAPIILRGVTWSTFKSLISEVGDDRAWRFTYEQGVLEIRMPLAQYEEAKILIECFITSIVDELEIELMSVGALTLEREDLNRAIEPDSCFYIQNESIVRGKNIDLKNVPPPDLVIESDYTNSSVNKYSIYAALGVPEIWRYSKQTLKVYQLVEGKYEECAQSLVFPFLPIGEIPHLIEQSQTMGQRATVRAFRERIRVILSKEKT